VIIFFKRIAAIGPSIYLILFSGLITLTVINEPPTEHGMEIFLWLFYQGILTAIFIGVPFPAASLKKNP
jgi:hypothetical protein